MRLCSLSLKTKKKNKKHFIRTQYYMVYVDVLMFFSFLFFVILFSIIPGYLLSFLLINELK